MSTWKDRIEDLRDKDVGPGMTLTEIGEAIGLSPGAVSDLAQGSSKSPRGDAAMKLVELHSQHFPRDNSASHASAGR